MMKKANIEFDRILFGPSTLVDAWWYSDNHLQMMVRFLGIQIGTGENISQLDIPEAVLIFRNVGSCTRSVSELYYGGAHGDSIDVSDDLKPSPGVEPKEFSFFAQNTEPSGNTNWVIQAESYEIHLRDDDVSRLNEAEHLPVENGEPTKPSSTW
jgi:hypothetical protein